MKSRIILDTGVLWDPVAMSRAVAQGQETVLPVVAFVERARQIQEAGRSVEELWAVIQRNQFRVEELTVESGLRFAGSLDQKTWDRHARDALIAGHVGQNDVLWTKNPKDFLKVGLGKEQIVAV